MAERAKAKWTRLASLGLVLAGLAPVLMLLAGLLFGLDMDEDLVFFVVVAAVAFIGAFLVWRFGTWSKVVGILAGALVGMAMFWTAFGLAAPASFFDFVPGILLIPGALIAIGAGIAALIAGRKGNLTDRPVAGERRGIQMVLGLVALLALVSGALNLFTRSTASADEAQATVAMKDFEFGEESYLVAGGSKVFVDNDDPFFHTFTIDGLDIDEGFVGGSSKIVDIPSEPGEYILYCKPHTSDVENPGDEDMATRITVT
jgi:hypothetical protein